MESGICYCFANVNSSIIMNSPANPSNHFPNKPSIAADTLRLEFSVRVCAGPEVPIEFQSSYELPFALRQGHLTSAMCAQESLFEYGVKKPLLIALQDYLQSKSEVLRNKKVAPGGGAEDPDVEEMIARIEGSPLGQMTKSATNGTADIPGLPVNSPAMGAYEPVTFEEEEKEGQGSPHPMPSLDIINQLVRGVPRSTGASPVKKARTSRAVSGTVVPSANLEDKAKAA